MENPNQISVTDANARSVKRDLFARRGFWGIGSAALAVAGISPAMAEDRSRRDPGPGNPALDTQTRIPCGRPARIQRAWFRPSSIRSPLRTSGFMKADGQEQPLSGPLAFGVADTHPARAGDGASSHR